jgi:hypothetical protein
MDTRGILNDWSVAQWESLELRVLHREWLNHSLKGHFKIYAVQESFECLWESNAKDFGVSHGRLDYLLDWEKNPWGGQAVSNTTRPCYVLGPWLDSMVWSMVWTTAVEPMHVLDKWQMMSGMRNLCQELEGRNDRPGNNLMGMREELRSQNQHSSVWPKLLSGCQCPCVK